jgi:hypothetical protein
LRDEKAAAEKQDCAVQENLKTLLVAEMQTRHRNIPREGEHGTGEQHQNAGDVFWPSLAQCRLIVVGTHPRPPTEKYTKTPSSAHNKTNVRMRTGLGLQRPFSSMGLSSSEKDSRREFCRLISESLL